MGCTHTSDRVVAAPKVSQVCRELIASVGCSPRIRARADVHRGAIVPSRSPNVRRKVNWTALLFVRLGG